MKTVKIIQRLAAACALAFAFAAPTPNVAAAAPQAQTGVQTFTHEAGGLTFEAPAGWKAEPDGEQLTVLSPDNSIAVVFWVTGEDDFKVAAEALDEELAKQIKGLKFDGEAKEGTHNGMPHVALTGSGQIEGDDIIFSVDLLMAKKPVIVLTFASPENFQKHMDGYRKLAKSVRKAA